MKLANLAFIGILTAFSVAAQAAPTQTRDRYAEAKKDIPEDVYPVYRALERLMQTNKVDGPVAITVRSATPEQCEAMTGNKGSLGRV